MKKNRAIVWFRQDLRLNDNEALDAALDCAEEVIPVYIFDPRTFEAKTSFGFPKTGAHRAQFIIEAVQDLRMQFRKMHVDIVVRVGKTEDILAEMAVEMQTSWIFGNMERMDEEAKIQVELEKRLWANGIELRLLRGKMLYHTQDLPFPIAHTPEIFTTFRKEVEKIVRVRLPLPCPTRFEKWTKRIDVGEIPTIADFGHQPIVADSRSAFPYKGGETVALEHMRHYFWATNAVKSYKETRNGLLGTDFSTKFSPFLAQGCLSAKTIYDELKRYEAAHGANESTYWVFFELLWRDYFRLMGKKHGNNLFKIGGLAQKNNVNWSENKALFEKWAAGKTGVPFIDANMRELNATGFMSNRGRQNVASYLVRDLKINWLMGAEYFESLLLDYDVCSNYGNWNYAAGVGNDPRDDRYFNIPKQAKTYDPNGDYVRTWLP
jgi:deoxyribodipyrimidine photo-lyase